MDILLDVLWWSFWDVPVYTGYALIWVGTLGQVKCHDDWLAGAIGLAFWIAVIAGGFVLIHR